jgi:hypothetical protein
MSCLPHTRNFCYYYLNLFENGSPSAVKKNWFSRGRLWIHIYRLHCLEIQNTYNLFTTILTKENYVNFKSCWCISLQVLVVMIY